jgi:hypothetical protein
VELAKGVASHHHRDQNKEKNKLESFHATSAKVGRKLLDSKRFRKKNDTIACRKRFGRAKGTCYLWLMVKRLPTILKKIPVVLATFMVMQALGCKVEDNEPPVVRINAPDTLALAIHNPLQYPSATAFDREDLDLTNKIQRIGNANKDSLGYYPIVYSATDNAGNIGQTTCVIHIYPKAYDFVGYFGCTCHCPSCGMISLSQASYSIFPGISPPLYYVSFSPISGTAGPNLEMYYQDGEFAFRQGSVPCSYNVQGANATYSYGLDTVFFTLSLKRWGTDVESTCSVTYVRM